MAILIFAENWDGKFKKLTFELLSYASGLSQALNLPVMALSIGKVLPDELARLAKYGVSTIVAVEDENFSLLDDRIYARLIADIATARGAKIVLMAHNNTGKGLAPRLAVRLGAGLATGVHGLPVSFSPFTVRKKVFSGKAFASQVIETGCKVLTLAQNSYEVIDNPVVPSVEHYQPDSSPKPALSLLRTEKQTGKILLSDADIVVSGGRGMKAKENWGPIEELASLLGAATACSRPVSDEGWRPHEEHTGQTGKIIAPNLYFAFGISGAIQHLAGVSSSKCIVAVNTDKDAPIFEAADYGIVGDALKVLPDLVQAVREARS